MYKFTNFVTSMLTHAIVIGTVLTILSAVALVVFAVAMALGFSFN